MEVANIQFVDDSSEVYYKALATVLTAVKKPHHKEKTEFYSFEIPAEKHLVINSEKELFEILVYTIIESFNFYNLAF